MTESPAAAARVPVREGLLTVPLDDLAAVRLAGSRCADCGETALGGNAVCPNCGGSNVSAVALGSHGTLWTYTVVRHRPPGNYLGPDPFEPFGMGLVELPDGVRVLSPIDCLVDELEIGMELRFRAAVRPGSDPEVVVFTFAPAAAEPAR